MRNKLFGLPLILVLAFLVLAFFVNEVWEKKSKTASEEILACLITKTNSNPFFVKMKEGAKTESERLGIKLNTYAGKVDGDNESQIAAVESCIVAGAKGILITPSDTKAIVPTIEKAKKAGILVIALDTPLDPVDAADATFATDNFKAGELIGSWAKKKLGGKASGARIALLDLSVSGITVDVARNQGFLKGFGIDLKDPNNIGDENDPRIVGNDVTQGNEEGGRRAMENLLQKNPNINVVYTINEPVAAGAYEALKAANKHNDVLIVSIDGGCPGVQNIKEGIIGATAMQFPLKMASLGIRAIVEFVNTGEKPKVDEELGFFNTGVELITDEALEGIDSKDSLTGLNECWG